jgi:hypothetical protein
MAEPESANLLLQHLLSTTFSGAEYDSLFKSVVDAVQKGGEANASAGRMTRVEAASRMYVMMSSSNLLRNPR